MPDTFQAVAKAEDIRAGEARVFEVAGHRVAVCNVEGTLYTVADTCTHDDGPLGAGALDGHAITCPRHGARFDVRDGAVLQMPAAYPVRSYPTRVVNGAIEVDFGEAQ